MKTIFAALALACIISMPSFAQGLKFSGYLDSKLAMAAGAGETPGFSYGVEEYANLRMQANIGTMATFYGALNLIAVSGNIAQAANSAARAREAANVFLSTNAMVYGENFAAALELERLYVRINTEIMDLDTGLMRMNFGYGQVWAPSDFLNPRNPLFPDARPWAVLGTDANFYPMDNLKLQAYAVAPGDPFSSDGGGSIFGVAGDYHWRKASIQLLYAYETPSNDLPWGVHRPGISLKADLVLGWVADILYTYDSENAVGIKGLSASGGFDYSFYDGKFYVLAEYLYNGESSVTSQQFSETHYLYGMIMYYFTDYTNASLACVAGLSDASFSPSVSFSHDLSQGVNISATAWLPLDGSMFSSNGKKGELGPERTGSAFLTTIKLRVRF